MRLRKVFYFLFAGLFMLTFNVMAQNPIQTENALQGTTAWQIPCSGTDCLGADGAFNRQIEGYASATSVNIGETITFYVNLTDGSTRFSMQIFRMGWYNGNGSRLVFSRSGIRGKHQPLPTSDPQTGLMECIWTLGPDAPAAYKWTVPTTAVSGVYLVKLTSQSNYSSYMIFVVRDDARQSDVLFQTSETTWQAYNNYPHNRDNPPLPTDPDPTQWGTQYSGKSLYALPFGNDLPPLDGNRQGRKVSFNRPYGIDNNRIDLTAGQFFTWEYNMVKWLERNGYDVTYSSNIDTHTANSVNGQFAPGKHKVFLSNGHDEYWSWEMRNNIEQARNRTNSPLNLGFFSANSIFWQIRFENSSSSSAPANTPNRTIVAYKNYAEHTDSLAADPFFTDTNPNNNYLITTLWRYNQKQSITGCAPSNPNCNCPSGNAVCTRPPEDEVMGVQYSFAFNQTGFDPDDMGTVCPTSFCSAVGDLIIPQSSCPTSLCNGMQAQNGIYSLGSLIGYEADRKFRDYSNRTLQIIGNSPVYNVINGSNVYTGYNSHLVYLTFPNQAKVFSTGTVQYAWGLDDYSPVEAIGNTRVHPVMTNSNAQTLTGNALNCLITNAVCQ